MAVSKISRRKQIPSSRPRTTSTLKLDSHPSKAISYQTQSINRFIPPMIHSQGILRTLLAALTALGHRAGARAETSHLDSDVTSSTVSATSIGLNSWE